MKKYSNRLLMTLFFMSFSVTVLSCGKIKRKGHQVLHESKVAVAEKIDRVIPSYDPGVPDTDNNKRRFKDHLGVAASADVNGLYTYADYLGIDYKVMMIFNCDQSTIDKIIKKNDMQLSTDEKGQVVCSSFTVDVWGGKVADMICYEAGEEDQFFQYLFYNPVTKQAYYEEFSM